MSDTLSSLLYRVGTDLPAVIVELVLIGLCVNWCAGVLQSTRGARPLRGVLVILIVVTMAVRILVARFGWVRLELLYSYFLVGLALIALVVFQPELRRAVIRLGDVRFRRRRGPQSQLVAALVKSAGYLSRNRYGALIAIQRDVDLTGWAENGTLIRAEVSANLLNAIFFPNSPLHDLGVIIRGNRLVAANCQFPSPDSDEIDAALGSRHLAAVGMSYETDALVLVVSEETGVISLADNGKLSRYLTLDDLAEELANRLGPERAPKTRSTLKVRATSQVWRRVRRLSVVVPLTLIIWYLTDQATFADLRVRLQLDVEHPNPNYVIDVREPRAGGAGAEVGAAGRSIERLHIDHAVFDATLRGPARAIDRLRTRGSSDALVLSWVVGAGDATPGTHTLSAAEVADRIDRIYEVAVGGLTVLPETLGELRYDIDERTVVRMRTEAYAPEVPIEVVRLDPPEARLAFRRTDLEQTLGANPTPQDVKRFAAEHVIAAPLADLVVDLEPQQTRTFEVALDPTIAGVQAIAMDPKYASVTVTVVGQTRTITGVPVALLVSPEVGERYTVEQLDLNEWRIDVEVVGKESIIRTLTAAQLDASARVTADMVTLSDEPDEPVLRQIEVRIETQDGVRVVPGRAPIVRVKLVPQGAAAP